MIGAEGNLRLGIAGATTMLFGDELFENGIKINAAFEETYEVAGSFGAMSLGECPAISPAPAVRNAVLDATGVAFHKIPLYPQVVFEKSRGSGRLGG